MKKESFLRPYQRKAIDKMFNGCILNGGVGSGKSRTGLYYYFKENAGSMYPTYNKMKNPKDLYIITTAKKRDSKEGEEELAPFRLSPKSELSLYNNKVVIDSGNNIKKYTDVENAFFIFDEQRVTGKGAGVKAFYKITKNNEWILLSATPGDTGSDYIPVFVANGFYKNKTEFVKEHIVYSAFTNYPKIDRYLNTGRLIRLRNKILIEMDFDRPTIQHHEIVFCDYDKDLYKHASEKHGDVFEDEPIKQASSYCYVLRRIVNSSEDRIKNLFEILERHGKAIVFYNFDYERDMLLETFGVMGQCKEIFEIAEGNGHAHEPVPTSDKWIYLVQYTAGNEGGNCITTNTIVFFSQNYSYKIMTQAAGRIDRLNTKFVNLYYYHLTSKSSIDYSISKALKSKKKFNEGVGYRNIDDTSCRYFNK